MIVVVEGLVARSSAATVPSSIPGKRQGRKDKHHEVGPTLRIFSMLAAENIAYSFPSFSLFIIENPLYTSRGRVEGKEQAREVQGGIRVIRCGVDLRYFSLVRSPTAPQFARPFTASSDHSFSSVTPVMSGRTTRAFCDAT